MDINENENEINKKLERQVEAEERQRDIIDEHFYMDFYGLIEEHKKYKETWDQEQKKGGRAEQ